MKRFLLPFAIVCSFVLADSQTASAQCCGSYCRRPTPQEMMAKQKSKETMQYAAIGVTGCIAAAGVFKLLAEGRFLFRSV